MGSSLAGFTGTIDDQWGDFPRRYLPLFKVRSLPRRYCKTVYVQFRHAAATTVPVGPNLQSPVASRQSGCCLAVLGVGIAVSQDTTDHVVVLFVPSRETSMRSKRLSLSPEAPRYLLARKFIQFP